MTDELALKILAEIAATGSGHLFSRREATRSAIALIEAARSAIALIETAHRVIEATREHWRPTMERREVIDLFGETVVIEISESKAVRKPTRPNGYAAPPGTNHALD